MRELLVFTVTFLAWLWGGTVIAGLVLMQAALGFWIGMLVAVRFDLPWVMAWALTTMGAVTLLACVAIYVAALTAGQDTRQRIGAARRKPAGPIAGGSTSAPPLPGSTRPPS